MSRIHIIDNTYDWPDDLNKKRIGYFTLSAGPYLKIWHANVTKNTALLRGE